MMSEASEKYKAMVQRAARRRDRMVTNVAENYEQDERWDLEFWQKAGPEGRLSALVAIREDMEKVGK
ncbi:MAG: hypothetical protein R6V03_03270 [Kiritimatiellia bacterium]